MFAKVICVLVTSVLIHQTPAVFYFILCQLAKIQSLYPNSSKFTPIIRKSFRKRKSTLKLELVAMINTFNKTDKMEMFNI